MGLDSLLRRLIRDPEFRYSKATLVPEFAADDRGDARVVFDDEDLHAGPACRWTSSRLDTDSGAETEGCGAVVREGR